MPSSDIRKMIRIANITVPITEIGIFDLPKAAGRFWSRQVEDILSLNKRFV